MPIPHKIMAGNAPREYPPLSYISSLAVWLSRTRRTGYKRNSILILMMILPEPERVLVTTGSWLKLINYDSEGSGY